MKYTINMKITVGDEIIKARQAAGLTQRQLADKIGVRLSTICAYEKGRCDPSSGRWDALADALNLDVETIYRWIHPAPEDSSLPTS